MVYQTFIWLIFVYAGAYITSQSEIGREFRLLFDLKKYNWLTGKLHYLINCIVCSGAYWAIGASLFFSPSAIFEIPLIYQLIINAIIGVGCNKLIYSLLERIP